MIIEKAKQLGLGLDGVSDEPKINIRLTSQNEMRAFRQLLAVGALTDMAITGVNQVWFENTLPEETIMANMELVKEWAAYMESHEDSPARLSVYDWYSVHSIKRD